MGKTSYSDREKAEALALVDANGGNVNETARMLGIPGSTVAKWVDGKRPVNIDVVNMAKGKRLPLADALEDMVYVALDYLPKALGRANAQQIAISIGILTEKMLLLRGQATVITENLLSDEAKAERVAILLEQARQRQLTGQPAGDTIPGSLAASQPDDSKP